jgi:hypothetical protein
MVIHRYIIIVLNFIFVENVILKLNIRSIHRKHNIKWKTVLNRAYDRLCKFLKENKLWKMIQGPKTVGSLIEIF